MTYKSRTNDARLLFLLILVALSIPGCKAACDIEDVQRCLPTIFGSKNVDAFRCSLPGKNCVNGLKRTCASTSISRLSDLLDYLCSKMGEDDLQAYRNCFEVLAASHEGLAKLNEFIEDLTTCTNTFTNKITSSSTVSTVCRASKDFESCSVSALKSVCQGTAARRFFTKFADLVDIGGCFSGVAARIPFISKLSMAVWAGILGLFLHFK